MNDRAPWTRDSLTEGFRMAGLQAGDLVLVHSALRRLGPVAGGAATVIEALRDAIGPGGTLALPAHTWKVVNADQPVFHQALTPANVGALCNVFRQWPGVMRSLHPTHSVAAIGPRAAELIADHERDTTPCPAGGPYGRLCDWGGKVLIIGADLTCCTIFHGSEERAGMPWAVKPQAVRLWCIAADGRTVPVDMHGHLVNTWDRYPRLEPHLVAAGAMRVTSLGGCSLRVLDARASSAWLVDRLRTDPSIILPEEKPSI